MARDDHGGALTGGSRRVVGGRDLPAAIAVGVVLASIFLGSLFWRVEAFLVVLLAIAGLALVEVTRVFRAAGGGRVELVPLLVATVVLLVAPATHGPSGQAVGVAVLCAGSVLWLLFDRKRSAVVQTLATTAFVGLWIPFLASYATVLVVRPDGPALVLAVIGAAIFADIGGYAFGVTLGRHKIAPSISPNKSWEGLIGGLVLAGSVAALVLPRLGTSFTPLSAAAFAVVCGIAGFAGDLMESMVKRELGVKDLGDLLPGHGGILDRVDGILFALPVGYAVLLLVG